MERDRWSGAIERILSRIDGTARTITEGFPHWADHATGQWVTTPTGDWTGGYWVGMLWLAHAATGDERYRTWARPFLERLAARVDGDTVFKSFPFYYGAALGWILAGEARARAVAIETARNLAKLYHPRLRLIPLGTAAEEGSHIGATETSIDSLQAAPFLFWAAREVADESMRAVAGNHAARIIPLHLRSDGSFIQSSSLDPNTGELVRHYTHKGVSETSTWGRAQAWGILFSTLSSLHGRRDDGWREAAMCGADWWIAHVPPDRVAFWDFDDPAIPNTERDTAATAIAAAGFLKLGTVAPTESKRVEYRRFAEATAEALVTRHLTPTRASDSRPPGMLADSCFNKRADARPQDAVTRCEFIVGSYYLFETLLGLAGTVDPARV